ncbi:cellulase family glycosylhydrolase [Tenacibaculum agarivorans]|uniref:cellulase family glycosylhydrolase n=1 Tax=Tenacibaculum agarivorans TaxID=1908389 RepID=UPI00094BB2D2|nr:cellulase family glycosylhydrolase [Tenacibaculum agarivorans]
MKKTLNKLSLLVVLFTSIISIAQEQNWLSVSGNKLIDSRGQEVRMTGVNWFGFETQNYFPHGIWTRDMKSVLQQIKDLGFNTIRVPWCNEMLDPGATIDIPSYGSDAYTGISPMNEEETKITKPIELLDVFVQWCQDNDIKIVLDNHSRAADGFLNEAFWYTAEYSEERWINDWIFMAERYKNYSAVVGMDLNNEPHGSSWGNSNPATDWNKAAERCGNAILNVNPNVLIIVEGVGEFEGNSYWWGGQLMGARQYPVQLSDPSKLMYSAHEYGPEVAPQDWFTASDFPQNMPAIWQANYDYLYEEGTSPIFLGEFGIKNQNAFGGIAFTWFTEFTQFMGNRYSWTFWSMNPNSGDTGGILQDDWASVNQWKLDVLIPYQAPLIPNVINGSGNRAPIARLDATPTTGGTPLTVQFDASRSSDADGDALTYTWDLGDGNTATGVTVSNTYSQAGQYRVTLTVSDGDLQSTAIQDIEVFDIDVNNPPVASFTTNVITGNAPLTVDFDASGSSDPDGDDLTYLWNFGNGMGGTGVIVSNQYTEPGSYEVVLTVSDGAFEVIDSKTIIVTANDIPNGCDFNTPSTNPLPSISNKIYENIFVLGNGPDLSNVNNLTVNWDLDNNGLWQFSMNTSNGVPSWWNNFLPIITQNFNQSQPEITITGSGFPGLDGSYWVALDGENFVLVSKTNGFTIYFSTTNQAPNCDQTAPTIQVAVSPNPVVNELVVQSSSDLQNATLRVVDYSGIVILEQEVKKSTNIETLSVERLGVGVYFVQVQKGETIVMKKVIKQF